MALRVFLVDDHVLFREGLRSLLSARGLEVVGTAGNGAEAVESVGDLDPDLVLMDLDMPVMGGLEATRLIKVKLPDLPVVVLTASEAEENLFEAVKSGAQGYLLKSLDPDALVDQIQAAARGEPALTPQLAAKILTEFARAGTSTAAETTPAEPAPAHSVQGERDVSGADGEAESITPLTAREREVLELLLGGATNKEIAQRLVVSENTTKYHLKNILQKLHAHNRAQVVAFALRHGLTRPSGA